MNRVTSIRDKEIKNLRDNANILAVVSNTNLLFAISCPLYKLDALFY